MAKLEYMKPYKITFWDHQLDGNIEDDEALCQTVGFFLRKYKQYYVFSYWELLNQDDTVKKANRETFRILKSTIQSVKLLK